MTFATGADRHRIVVGSHAAGDEGLAAVDDVVVAVPYGAGSEAGDVGAAAGFGNGQGGNGFASQDRGDDLLANFLSGPFRYWRQADVQGAKPGHKAAGGGAHELLGDGHFQKDIAFTRSAQFLWETDAQQSGIAGLSIEIPGEFPGFFPVIDVRQYVGLNKLAGTQTCLFVGIVEVIGHSRAPSQSTWMSAVSLRNRYQASAWFGVVRAQKRLALNASPVQTCVRIRCLFGECS